MTGIERITERILADAKERARVILETAQNDCRALAEDFAARADALRDAIAERAMREGEDVIARARSSAARTRRNLLLDARRRVLDEAFEAAKREICDTDYGKYRELLVALLSSALIAQADAERESIALGDEVAKIEAYEVRMNAADRAALGAAVIEGARAVCERRIGAERFARVHLSDEDADIDGGLLLRFGAVEVNCSIAAVIGEVRRTLEPRVADILFAEEGDRESERDRS